MAIVEPDFHQNVINLPWKSPEERLEIQSIVLMVSCGSRRGVNGVLVSICSSKCNVVFKRLQRMSSLTQHCERVVDHILTRGVEIRLDRSEGVPAADGHYNPRVHLFVDEEALGEPSTKVVGAHLLEVRVAGLVSCTLGGPTDDRSDARLLQIDKGVFRRDVVLVLVALKIPLDAVGEVGIAGLPTAATGVFPRPNTESVLAALAFLDVRRPHLWNLEGT